MWRRQACLQIIHRLRGSVRLLAAPSTLALLTLLAVLGPRPAVAQTTDNNIKIGIISPKEGSRTSAIGAAHEAAIRLGFDALGPIRVGGRLVNVQFIGWNDKGDPALSKALALQLANDQKVAAILGPVNSAATIAALAGLKSADVSLPVISSLSTAPDLLESGRRDPNFFRLTFDDAGRMAAYAIFIEGEKRGQSDQGYLFLYENDVYGVGLKDALVGNFYTSNIETRSWCEVLDSPCDPATRDLECQDIDPICDVGMLRPESYALVQTGRQFSQEFLRLLAEDGPQNVVILGTADGTLALALGLETLGRRLDYFLVGNTKELFDKAPAGSIVIGNPVLDPERAPTVELRSKWENILSDFEQKGTSDRSDFMITAYEAGMVIHTALRTLLRDRTTVPPLEELRAGLLGVLETQTFDALEPWRRIRFSDGGLTEPPTAPIFRISRGQSREDPASMQEWVEIDVFPRFNYLESPIRAELTSHSVNTALVTLSRIEDGVPVLQDVRTVDFSAGRATVDFHVLRTGIYRIALEGAAYAPTMAETQVVISRVYFISALTAFLAAMIVVCRVTTHTATRLGRSLLGVVAGLIFTFSSLYGREVAEWFPFPSFGEEPIINALITGLIGGLLGPYFLPEILMAWALLFAVAINRNTAQSGGATSA